MYLVRRERLEQANDGAVFRPFASNTAGSGPTGGYGALPASAADFEVTPGQYLASHFTMARIDLSRQAE